MKKTLIAKLPCDVSLMNTLQIGAYQGLLRSFFESQFPKMSFELIEEDEEDRAAQLLQRVREEFKESDQIAASSERIDEQF